MASFQANIARTHGYGRRAQVRTFKPLAEWDEYAHVRRLASELANPALLALSTRRLVEDVMQTRGVGKTYAYRAVGFARSMAREMAA